MSCLLAKAGRKEPLCKDGHYTSRRQRRPFLALNCATLTENLLASELFGYEKGAFTGAVIQARLGRDCRRGTLFLDEITEMTNNLQAKLLKVIEDGDFFRVGGTKAIKVDVRFPGATNQNLKQPYIRRQSSGRLYYRLNVMEIIIPPLREHREDISVEQYFLAKASAEI